MLVAAGQCDYNEHRLHGSLDYLIPAEFGARYRSATHNKQDREENWTADLQTYRIGH